MSYSPDMHVGGGSTEMKNLALSTFIICPGEAIRPWVIQWGYVCEELLNKGDVGHTRNVLPASLCCNFRFGV